jgi:hypothetical protein
MTPDLSDLNGEFRSLTDAELLARCASGTLTDIAQAVAAEEIAARGLGFPPARKAEQECGTYEGDFETVARFLDATQAHLVCACLRAARLPAVVADANLVQTNSLWSAAMGGARVMVPAHRVAEAKEVIEAFNRGDFALPDDAGPLV